MAKSLKIGDIFEIQTPNGFAYLQYTQKDPALGHLIRVLAGNIKQRQKSFKEIASTKELFFVFFPLSAAERRKIVTWVANEEIPAWAKERPMMKKRGGITRDGKVLNWIITDGTDEQIVKQLTEEQKEYSPEEIWNDTMLVQRICKGWMPRDEA